MPPKLLMNCLEKSCCRWAARLAQVQSIRARAVTGAERALSLLGLAPLVRPKWK